MTLNQMLEEYILDSEEKNLSWDLLTVYRNNVKPSEAHDTETDVKEVRNRLHTKYSWYGMGDEGKRVFEVLKDVDQRDEMECLAAWEKHLRKNIDFPVEAEIYSTSGVQGFSTGDRVRIDEILFKDDLYGLIVESPMKVSKRNVH